MKKSLFSIFLTFFALAVFGQELKDELKNTDISLSGEIINKEDGELVPYVHIINLSTNQGTTSDMEGKFNISISSKDTLMFSSVGFDKYKLTFSDHEIDSDSYFIRILLDQSSYELSPVNIFAFKDEAGFKQDILNMKLPEDSNTKIIIPGSYGGPLTSKDLNGGFSLGSPISSVVNIFSKEAKELRKYERVMKDYPRQKTINEKYNMEVVEQITGLKDEDLNKFMLFCKISDDYILTANDYEIVVAVHNCYKEFVSLDN